MLAKAVVIHEFGGPEVLRLERVDVPDPGPGEVRIRIEAFGLNRAEVMIRRNLYADQRATTPARIGFEATGTIESVAPDVKGFATGDRVGTLPFMPLNRRGCHAELVTVPAHAVVQAAPELDAVGNAAIWSSYITCYFGLVERADLRKGDFVLVTAASSSCGAPAIQIANMMGVKPIAVTRSRAKADAIQAMGAHATIPTDVEDLATRVAEITGGRGVQAVFDPVGGPMLDSVIDTLSYGGIYVLYGLMDFTPVPLPTFKMLRNSLTIRAFSLDLPDHPERDARAIAYIREGIASAHLAPVIARTFALDDIVAAAEFFDSMQQIGKVVVVTDGAKLST